MRLTTRWNSNANPEVLPATEHELSTGPLFTVPSIAVIVLAGLVGARYSNVRGYKATFGLVNVNWVGLFNGVPNDATTVIITIAGPGYGSEPRRTSTREMVEAARNHYVGNADIEIHYEQLGVTVDRFGQVLGLAPPVWLTADSRIRRAE